MLRDKRHKCNIKSYLNNIKQDEIVYEQSCEIFTKVSHINLSLQHSFLACVECVYVCVCVLLHLPSLLQTFYKFISRHYYFYVCCQHEELLEMIQGTFDTNTYMNASRHLHYNTHADILGSQPQMNNSKEACLILCVRNSSNVIVIYANLT